MKCLFLVLSLLLSSSFAHATLEDRAYCSAAGGNWTRDASTANEFCACGVSGQFFDTRTKSCGPLDRISSTSLLVTGPSGIPSVPRVTCSRGMVYSVAEMACVCPAGTSPTIRGCQRTSVTLAGSGVRPGAVTTAALNETAPLIPTVSDDRIAAVNVTAGEAARVTCSTPKTLGPDNNCVCPTGTIPVGESCGCSGDTQLQGNQCVALTEGTAACTGGKVRDASNTCVCPDRQSEQNGTCAPAAAVAPSGTTATATDQENSPDTFASYDPNSCEWTPHLPRKIHTAPGCTRSTTNEICVGYVVCSATNGGGKFVRTATCGASHCGDSEARDCVNDRSHSSHVPSESEGVRKFLSNEVKQVIGQ